jgi:hypothetical protein
MSRSTPTNWIARTRMILDHGTTRPFKAFDREAMLRREAGPVADLLAGFRASRSSKPLGLTSRW